MQLGKASLIQVSTVDLVESLAFYLEMGFRIISEGEEPEPWAQITDGSVLLLLSQNNEPEWNLTYFNNNVPEVLRYLEKEGIPIDETLYNRNELLRVSFKAPGGLLIRLVNMDPSILYQPRGKALRNLDEDELRDTQHYANHSIGIFGEMTLPVQNLQEALSFWEKIGFQSLTINYEPYPWAIITDNKNTIGLHETQEYIHPALTYFAADMRQRIQKLRAHGAVKLKAMSGEDEELPNAVLSSPEGMTFFLFSF